MLATFTFLHSERSTGNSGMAYSVFLAVLLTCLCLLTPTDVIAQDREFVIATKEAPPFAMLGADNQWHGLSISIWEHLAKQLNINYRFEEASLAYMVNGVADGRFDASISAMTITHERERVVDFSHPF